MSNLRIRKKSWRERKSIVSIILIILFVALLAAVIVVWKLNSFSKDNLCSAAECVESSFFLLDLIDSKVDPCDNFYNFTCGNYMGELVMKNLQNTVDRRIKSLITSPAEVGDSRSVKLQKKYYHACMNLTGIEEDQNETLMKLFDQLGGWPVLMGDQWNEIEFQWSETIEKCKDLGLYYDWFINIENFEEKKYENKLYITAPDNANKIEDTVQEKYVDLMVNVVKILDAPGNGSNITENMREVMQFESELLKIIEQTQLNATDAEYTLEDIENKFPYIPWSSILKNVVIPKTEKIVCNAESYLEKLAELLTETPKSVQANYIFWKLTESFSAFLTYDARKQFDAFADLSGHYKYPKDRKDFCFGITSTVFAYVSEAEYVRKYAADRDSVKDIVNRLKSVLYDHIENARWMSQSDKSLAFFKLKNVKVIIGGPEEMYNEREFDRFLGVDQIDLSDVNNTIEIICEVDKNRDLYNLDFEQPKLTMEQARFYQGAVYLSSIKYLPDENIMFLPAAALDSLFYSQNRPSYLNYGVLGTIIGHELAHGFGIQGNTIYEDGKEKIQWTNYTYENFIKAADCLLEDCNSFGTEADFWMSCNDTFEESFADYVGIALAYEAYRQLQEIEGKGKSIPGLQFTSNQLFWIMYSAVMCNNIVVNSTEEISHTLPSQRIIGAFRNTEYFAKDFNCAVGSNMNPSEKCKIL